MSFARRLGSLVQLAAGLLGARCAEPVTSLGDSSRRSAVADMTDALGAFSGSKAGDEREVAGIKLCWRPPGRFTMGSPAGDQG